ncbi:hypothetical protein FocTR4_00010952 [Fusarium oxysporum f. sp. cubense]|uniref:CoA-binding domain-containing protein n=1 Tax=Fusarium oxysporum f. sp. cubense TaxID=61366 RepID=A0A5C6SF70_FUSOC|nr:hypothetical protein FocTR4_00010952 [Fusarium oxysporum f. sp. cubense]
MSTEANVRNFFASSASAASSLPSVTLKVLQEAKELRIPSAWLQPGSFDDDVLKFANEQGGFNAVVAGDAGRVSKGVAEAINTLAQQVNLFKIEVEAAQRPRDAVEDLLRQMVAQLGGINTRLRTFEGSVNRMEATVAGQARELGALLVVLGVRCNRTAERKRAAFFNAIGITLMAH